MSTQITTAFVQGYKAGFDIKFQQMGSRLRSAVRVETQNAEYEFYDRVTAVTAVERTTRHQDTTLINTPQDRRRIGLKDFEIADLIDQEDRIRLLTDPSNAYTTSMVMAHGRAMDDAIITAFTADAASGKTGSTAVTFPSASEIAVDFVHTGAAANSNLTISKLREAARLLDSQEIPDEGRFLVFGSSQKSSLLRTTEITNSDYNTVKALANGSINTFMGFTFIRSERLTVASNIRDCFAFWNQAMMLGVGADTYVSMDRRPDKGNSLQVLTKSSFGSTRMWEEGVLRIKCDETR